MRKPKRQLPKEARKFRRVLKGLGYSQIEYAERIDYTPRQINSFATGKAEIPALIWGNLTAEIQRQAKVRQNMKPGS